MNGLVKARSSRNGHGLHLPLVRERERLWLRAPAVNPARAFFESLVGPFAEAVPAKPSRSPLVFIWRDAKPIAPHLLPVSLTAAVFAVPESAFFDRLGNLLDSFAAARRETSWASFFWCLVGAGLLSPVIMPLIDAAYNHDSDRHLARLRAFTGNSPRRRSRLAPHAILGVILRTDLATWASPLGSLLAWARGWFGSGRLIGLFKPRAGG